MALKSFKNRFYSNQKARRFGWSLVILAIAANLLIFLLIGWVNREPASYPPEGYTVIEVFKPELVPENILPQIDSSPVIVETKLLSTPKPMQITKLKEFALKPRLIEWIPDSLLNQHGVSIDITPAEIESPDVMYAADISGVLALNQVDQPPRKISGTSPAYPIWARANKAEGSVVLRFIVGIDGEAHNIEVHSIRGDERFTATAIKAVEKWRFKPAVCKGKPVAVWCLQNIQFQFED